MDRNLRESADTHFHIRWVRSNRLDWEAFANVREAEVRGNELKRPGEVFQIEKAEMPCRICGEKPTYAKSLSL